MDKTLIHKYYADSLEEIFQYVDKIGQYYKKDNILRALWFRGHEYTYFNLEPNLFRQAEYHYNTSKTYSNNHLREDYRYQHFMARNFDKLDYREPRSVFEWQEIMQHFFSKTRLMDWSESLFSALEFALESYLIPYKNLEISDKRRKMQPTLWILQPNQLNNLVYDALIEDKDFKILKQALGSLYKYADKIGGELREHKNIYFSLDDPKEQNFNNIVSITALEDLKRSYAGNEERALSRMELNPFFYLLLRIYADGVPVDCGTVPPLAIIHPYHSQRIKAQKGVFTVSPYYIPGEREKQIKNMGIKFNPIAMEYMSACQECLYEIQLTNPGKIAEQMRKIGYKSSDLYPDTQRVAQDMENTDFSI